MLTRSGTTEPEAARRLGPSSLADQVAAERAVLHSMVKGIAISVPILTMFFVGLVALAVGFDQPGWPAWLGMAVGVGVLAGTFFGTWAGFIAGTHTLDELDRHCDGSAGIDARPPAGTRSSCP